MKSSRLDCQLMIRQLIQTKSFSILKHVYTFLEQVDKLDDLINWSRLELSSQVWAKEMDSFQ